MSPTFIHAPWCRRAKLAALVTLLLVCSAGIHADEAQNTALVKALMTKDLTGLPDKEAVVLTVEYLPGGASLPHRHDAHVFVYVLEGSLVMQVEGQQQVTLKPGETFYESPQDIHSKSANASTTEPAKFLVVMVKDKGKPASRPVASE